MKKLILTVILIFVMGTANFANAAEIDRAFYLGNPDVSYPLIIAQNSAATNKINIELRNEIKKFLDQVNRQMIDGQFNSVMVTVDYHIPCNHDNGILSIVLDEYVNFEKSAHPSAYQRALNFNSSSGERIFSSSLTEIAKKDTDYTPADITQKLRAFAEKNKIYLFADFQRLTEVPEDFYFDDDLHVHFIFQQYEVAPYAVGIIDLDADATY